MQLQGPTCIHDSILPCFYSGILKFCRIIHAENGQCEEQKDRSVQQEGSSGHVLQQRAGMPRSHCFKVSQVLIKIASIVLWLSAHRNVVFVRLYRMGREPNTRLSFYMLYLFPRGPHLHVFCLSHSLDLIFHLLCVSLDPPSIAFWATGFWKTTSATDFISVLCEHPFSLEQRPSMAVTVIVLFLINAFPPECQK